MHVVATAGHVDHGKSTLVRALTGREPDRWAEERRRGLTIDLGYVWTELPGVGEIAFVDVPGHRRFIGNMLAGLGPVPAVMVVVAADSGWSAQSEEHLLAIDALGIGHGLLAVTRADLVDAGRSAQVREDALRRLESSSLGAVPSIVVSGVTGHGLAELRAALGRLCGGLPAPRTDARVRLWVDRSFTMRGAGTVVTGTLGEGTIRVGDQLQLRDHTFGVRGVQSLEVAHSEVPAVARVAVNLRGADAHHVRRGDALLTPEAWSATSVADVRLTTGGAESATAPDLPAQLTCHVGTAAATTRARPLAGSAFRLTFAQALPLEAGDRVILRDPGHEGAIFGAVVIDPAPPPLTRRGAGAARGAVVLAAGHEVSLADDVLRRDVLSLKEARLLGHDPDAVDEAALAAAGVVRLPHHLVAAAQYDAWLTALVATVVAHEQAHPLDPHLPMATAQARSGLPDLPSLEQACAATELVITKGRVHRPGVVPDLGEKQKEVDGIVSRLTAAPFAAPEQPDLDAAGLGPREVAAAVATGQLIRIPPDILLLPTSPARAMRILAALPQPFTTSEARLALGTTRRVAIPLLEHLDARGWTRRTDTQHREVAR